MKRALRERVNADGVDIAECELVEAKHVGDLQKNPWLHPERLPERVRDNILGQPEDEFRRYAGVIKDPMTPAKGLRVIVSDAAAKSLFE